MASVQTFFYLDNAHLRNIHLHNSFLQVRLLLGDDTRFGQLAFHDGPDQLRCDLPSDFDVLFIQIIRFRFGSRHMQESNPSRLIGLETLRQAVEVNIVTEKMTRISGDIQGNVIGLPRHVSKFYLPQARSLSTRNSPVSASATAGTHPVHRGPL